MKKVSKVLLIIALMLSHAMCAVVAYAYRDMLCCIAHNGCSAPASVALAYAIPFVIGISVCAVLVYIFRKRSR